jgi:hypothetical protein
MISQPASSDGSEFDDTVRMTAAAKTSISPWNRASGCVFSATAKMSTNRVTAVIVGRRTAVRESTATVAPVGEMNEGDTSGRVTVTLTAAIRAAVATLIDIADFPSGSCRKENHCE